MLEINTLPNGKREIVATEGVVCRKGHNPSPDNHRMQMLPTDTIENFEEYTELPPYTKDEYDSKVAELIRQKYSSDEENAIKSKAIAALLPDTLSDEEREKNLEQFAAFNAYREECKVLAKNPDLYPKMSNAD